MGSFAQMGLHVNITTPLCCQVFAMEASIKKMHASITTRLTRSQSKQADMTSALSSVILYEEQLASAL